MDNLDEHSMSGDITTQETISLTAKTFLNKASGWVKVVAILGIVFSSLGIIAGIFSLIALPILGIFYLITYGLGIYISLILLKVSNSSARGSFNLDKFAENFYLYWKTIVVITIVMVGLSLIMGIYFAVSGVGVLNNRF